MLRLYGVNTELDTLQNYQMDELIMEIREK